VVWIWYPPGWASHFLSQNHLYNWTASLFLQFRGKIKNFMVCVALFHSEWTFIIEKHFFETLCEKNSGNCNMIEESGQIAKLSNDSKNLISFARGRWYWWSKTLNLIPRLEHPGNFNCVCDISSFLILANLNQIDVTWNHRQLRVTYLSPDLHFSQ
jgi:hypothetical protein